MKDPIDFLNDGKIREMTLRDGSKIYIFEVRVLSVLVGKNKKTAKLTMVDCSPLDWGRPYIKWNGEELFLDEFKISKERKK